MKESANGKIHVWPFSQKHKELKNVHLCQYSQGYKKYECYSAVALGFLTGLKRNSL